MITLSSPAKINLFLLILGKRSDGYHELASLLQAIDLSDKMTLALSSEDRLTCTDPTLPCDPTNLISKAITLFRHKTNLLQPVSIHLEKIIPTQAGLGGGSSNAATTLWGMNLLHGSPVSVEELQKWSAEIGSDVPFFFSQGTALCTGRGELVRNLPFLNLEPLSLFKPKESLTTPAVYQALKISNRAQLNGEKLLEEFYSGDPFLHNELEEPAFRLLPVLHSYREHLQATGLRQVTLSGSGSALFGLGQAPHTQAIRCMHRASNAWY